MLESINNEKATTEVRYALKVITIFGGELYKDVCINKFYEKGLSRYIIGYMKDSPKMVFNFLQKMHGIEFKLAFPVDLTKYFLQVILDCDPTTQPDHMKAALRITRFRLEALHKHEQYNTEQLTEILLDPLEQGLPDKLYHVIERSIDVKERQYAYNVIRDLINLVNWKLKAIGSLLIDRFIYLGLMRMLDRDYRADLNKR